MTILCCRVSRGHFIDGFIETISIDSSGNIGDSVIDSIEFDIAMVISPMTMIDSDTVATYQGHS
jgi:hypothetical protein